MRSKTQYRSEIARIVRQGKAGDSLAGMVSEARGIRTIAHRQSAKKEAWTWGLYQIEIVRINEQENCLSLDLKITRAGKAIPIDNPCIFVNPPLLVADPEGDITLEGASGKFREDVDAARRGMIEQMLERLFSDERKGAKDARI